MLTLGYISGQLVQEPFCSSLMFTLMRELVEPDKRAITEVMRSRGLYLDDNRHELACGFLKGTNPFLMMIDTDVEFHRDLPREMLAVMLAEGKWDGGPKIGVLGLDLPLWPRTVPEVGFTHSGFLFDEESGEWKVCTEINTTRPLLEVDAVAYGAVIFRREALLAAGAPDVNVFERWYKGKKIGEDIAACSRIREAGWKIALYQSPTVTKHWHAQPFVMPKKESKP
jgi:hypothetical protein